MSFKSLAFAYIIGLAVVSLMCIYAPWLGIGAGLFSIGYAAWSNNWACVPYAVLGIVMWSIAVQYPGAIIGICALIGLFSYARIYRVSNEVYRLPPLNPKAQQIYDDLNL